MDFWKNPHLLLVMSKQILCHHHLFLWASTRAASTRFSWHVFLFKKPHIFLKGKDRRVQGVLMGFFTTHHWLVTTGFNPWHTVRLKFARSRGFYHGLSAEISFDLMLGLVTDTTVFNVLLQSMVTYENLTRPLTWLNGSCLWYNLYWPMLKKIKSMARPGYCLFFL